MQDPQSLHKYLYVHGDPISGIDATGESLLGSVGGFLASSFTNLSYTGVVTGVLASVVGGGLYSYKLGGTFIEGTYVSSQIYFSLYISRIMGPKPFLDTLASGTISGLAAVLAEIITQGGNPNDVEARVLVKRFVDSFGKTAFSATSKLFLPDHWSGYVTTGVLGAGTSVIQDLVRNASSSDPKPWDDIWFDAFTSALVSFINSGAIDVSVASVLKSYADSAPGQALLKATLKLALSTSASALTKAINNLASA